MNVFFRRGLVLGLALLSACQQPAKQDRAAKPQVDDTGGPIIKPWTDAFSGPAVLFADEIWVEGPEGMIDRTALRVDPELNDTSTRTTKDGLLQVVTVKPDVQAEVHGFLDHWELVGFRKVSILERVVPCDVKVRASGAAHFVDTATKAEQNQDTLEFTGKIPR
ncbi:MAG: hypothetical protein IPJ19_10310 [Planctomycetes bacterium]|nr:hypothetical protein [Planctomycetota bacterium]